MKFNLNLDSINYIKIVYKDYNGNVHCTKAAIKRMGEREIFACAKFEELPAIKTPQDVALSIVCDSGLYRTSTTLKYIENDEPYMFFGLRTPDGLEYQQNREYFRVKIKEDAILSYYENGQKHILSCKTHDISANGVRLELNVKIAPTEPVIIDILFSPKNIKAKAEYVRTDTEDGIQKVAFRFINMPESDVDVISQICIKKQLEYKRKTAL